MCNFTENNISCKNKKKYGDFCYKHRSLFLINNNKIIFDNFTGKCGDYLKKDIINTLNSGNSKELNKLKKGELFQRLQEYFQILNYYKKNETKIITIQKGFKGFLKKYNLSLRGEGFYNKLLCNNDIDFFSYETINEIEDKYFFSYKDNKGFIWFFDIRSFDKLLQMKQGNPYTREGFSQTIIHKAKKIIHNLKLSGDYETVDKTIVRDRRQSIKQKTVDLFSLIDSCGYDCNINWFVRLNIIRLKKLYKALEDIWNYRLQLSNEVKARIAPPNGQIFIKPIPEVMAYNHKEDLQDLILNEVSKFNNAEQESDRKLGYMYFIIGLSSVCRECLYSHPWIMYVN